MGSGHFLFCLFQFKQLALQIQSSGITGQILFAAYNTMTGYDNPKGIFVAGHANGSRSFRLTDMCSDLTISANLAVGDFQQTIPDSFLKRCAL